MYPSGYILLRVSATIQLKMHLQTLDPQSLVATMHTPHCLCIRLLTHLTSDLKGLHLLLVSFLVMNHLPVNNQLLSSNPRLTDLSPLVSISLLMSILILVSTLFLATNHRFHTPLPARFPCSHRGAW